MRSSVTEMLLIMVKLKSFYMQNNRYQRPRQRPLYRSVDGFSSPTPNTSRYPSSLKTPSQTSATNNNVSSTPKPISFNGSSLNALSANSLLNKTIPGVNLPALQGRSTVESKNKKRSKLTKKKVGKRSVLALLLLAIITGGFFGYKDLNVINKVFHGNLFSDAQALFGTAKLNGESTGRVNILLAGYQGSASDEGPLTDSIMVVSLDTQNNTAFTISIPRDLWVKVSGMGHEKINAANTNTGFNQAGYFSGGMGQLQQVVEQKMGIPINYYALIDYTAFEDAVNAVGGITVNIRSTDPRGLYDPNVDKAHGGPLKLRNGPVTLNGLSALALALARGDSYYSYGFPQSDINRTQHQRQMLIALEQKATTTGVLSNPITISKLVNTLGDNVTTNLTLPDVLRAAQLARKVNAANVQSYGLTYGGTNPLLTTYVAPDGEDSLIPNAGLDNFSQIQQYYQQITSNNPVVKEDATVVVINASTAIGIATKEEAALKAKGFDVIKAADSSSEYPASMVVNLSGGKTPASLQALQQTFTSNTTFVTSSTKPAEATEAQNYSADFVVVLGQNWNSGQQQ